MGSRATDSIVAMASIRGLKARVRGERMNALSAEVARIRDMVIHINDAVDELHRVVMELNHDVRSGAERSLPLFLGYSERLRLDADTAVGATQVIERQLAVLDERLAALGATSTGAVTAPGDTASPGASTDAATGQR